MKTLSYHEQIAIISDAGSVYISITADNGQKVRGSIRDENNKVLAVGLQNGFKLGTGASLRGKTYRVITNGMDVLPNTNVVQATHSFSGDGIAALKKFPFPKDDETVDPADGLICYNVRYTFN